MKFLEELLDQYNLRARVIPAFVMILPEFLAVVAIFPVSYQGPVGVVAGILTLVILYHLSDWVRERGLKAQNRLYKEWGGKPSVLLLSHFQNMIAPDTLMRCHKKIIEIDPTLKIPQSREEEQNDPARSTEIYRSCNELLLERTRDKSKYSLLQEENIRYGGRRNKYGVRWVAFALAVGGFVTATAAGAYRAVHSGEPDALSVIAAVTGLFLTLYWLLVVRSGWVRRQAETYAVRLILSAQSLDTKDSKPAKEGS